MSNDPKQIEIRKAWSFMSVLAGMGAMAKAFTPWRPRKFVGAAEPKRRVLHRTIRHRHTSDAHVAAVSLMREARRLKRMVRAENELSEKRAAARLRSFAGTPGPWPGETSRCPCTRRMPLFPPLTSL